MIKVTENRVEVETSTLAATIDRGFLVSLRSRRTNEEFLRPFDLRKEAALRLMYPADEEARIDEDRFGRVYCRQLSDRRAEMIFHSWEGDGVLEIREDAETGDLVVCPAAYSSRPGVRACRWSINGIRKDLELVAPLFQGVKLKLDDALIRESRWRWPITWEAALAILQGPQGGFWIHAQDDRYRYKTMRVRGGGRDGHTLSFDSEAYGPTDANLSAGGLAWRINVYDGDWRTPATRYRDWLWQTYGLEAEAARRREWVQQIRLALSWCPGDLGVLEALAGRVPPNRVLLHFPNWRSDGYDENYPTYTASEKGKEFIARSQEMGFHIMPHFNSVDMDPTHPVYALVRDFQYRGSEGKRISGWSWHNGQPVGIPESNFARLGHRDKKVMVKIHPGLSMWRSILGESIQRTAQELTLDTVFIDVTLTSGNLHNCLVEGMTSTEGMKRLIEHVAGLGEGLVVAGEGLNEITMQGLSFAQAHLFESWHKSIGGLARTGGCDLNNLLFGKLCRTIGYSGLGGRNEDEALRMNIHEEHGAIPTLTVSSPEEIRNPNQAVSQVLERAASA